MEKTIVCQGRILESDDLDWLKGWVAANRPWSRHRLAKELCRAWDWREKYGHPIQLVETFVERGRYKGTCYRAANWILVGQTKGRSRQDRYTTMKVPVKDVYLYPLKPSFREALCHVQP